VTKTQQPKRKYVAVKRHSRSQALADEFIQWIASGKSFASFCKPKERPSFMFFWEWMREDVDFAERYSRARELQAEMIVDDLVRLADSAMGMDKNGIAAMRLMVDTRKWAASKLLPRKYADRIEAVGVGEGGRVALAIIVPMKDLPGASAEPARLERDVSRIERDQSVTAIDGRSERVIDLEPASPAGAGANGGGKEP
jgi:hypothetical protein